MISESDLARWESRVDKSGECWIWTGYIDHTNYGRFWWNGRQHMAHRFSYEAFVGPIPTGLDLDHLCHSWVAADCRVWANCPHRTCVRPDHLEAVTRQENVRRGNTFQHFKRGQAECQRGHEFTSENTGIDTRGKRYCRTCKRARGAAARERRH